MTIDATAPAAASAVSDRRFVSLLRPGIHRFQFLIIFFL
jgi:hypothetical protein